MYSSKTKNYKYIHRAKKWLVSFYFLIKKNILKILKFKKKSEASLNQDDLDKKLIYLLSKSKIPNLKQIKYIKKFLSKKEIWIMQICLTIIFLNLFIIGLHFYKTHYRLAPTVGGEYVEGLIGSPVYINPLYAYANDVDNDISQLVFSSLFKGDENGRLVNDLASGHTISEDNKVYTITLRQDIKWHNGEKLTADDMVFTFSAIKNSQYKSSLRASFSGVEIKKIDEKTINFILEEPYAAFLELLTFGIIPQNLWMQIPPESANLAKLNLNPIGSGPYKFKSLIKDSSGNIKSYNLELNDDYYGDKPYIKNITFILFVNFEEAANALNENTIDGISYLPQDIKEKLAAQDSLFFHKLNMPQITAIFFNQKNNEALRDKKVRQILARSINKNEIISEILPGQAHLIDGPILPNNFAYNKNIEKYKYSIEEASAMLNEAGWKEIKITVNDIIKNEKDEKNNNEENLEQKTTNEELSEEEKYKIALGEGNWRKKDNKYLIITLTTVETDTNIKIVQSIKKLWEKIGIKVNLNIIPANQIQSEIIRPRNFEALLYGQVAGNDPDCYAFWHSSQIGESGLNIANYTNKEVDTLLEDARLTSNIEERIEKYKKFQEIIADETPAIFIYSPLYTYVQSKKIKDFSTKNILNPSDRFSSIAKWYIKTKKKLFWNNKTN